MIYTFFYIFYYTVKLLNYLSIYLSNLIVKLLKGHVKMLVVVIGGRITVGDIFFLYMS